jgi:flagellar biosynthetic protein FliQ
MTPDSAVELTRAAIFLAVIVSTPPLVASMFIGLIVSMLQAVTQIQDQTISFVPKLVIMLLAILLTLPWTIQQLTEYTVVLFENIPLSL